MLNSCRPTVFTFIVLIVNFEEILYSNWTAWHFAFSD